LYPHQETSLGRNAPRRASARRFGPEPIAHSSLAAEDDLAGGTYVFGILDVDPQ
jgi:hypothetical protein